MNILSWNYGEGAIFYHLLTCIIKVIPKFQHRQFILENFQVILCTKAKEESVVNYCKYVFSVRFVKRHITLNYTHKSSSLYCIYIVWSYTGLLIAIQPRILKYRWRIIPFILIVRKMHIEQRPYKILQFIWSFCVLL